MIEVWRPGRPPGERRPREASSAAAAAVTNAPAAKPEGQAAGEAPRSRRPPTAAPPTPRRRPTASARNVTGAASSPPRPRRAQGMTAARPSKARPRASRRGAASGSQTPATGRRAARASRPSGARRPAGRGRARPRRDRDRAATTTGRRGSGARARSRAATRSPIRIRRSPSCWRLKEQLEGNKEQPERRSGPLRSDDATSGPPAHRQMAVARAGGAHALGRRGAGRRRPRPHQRRAHRQRRAGRCGPATSSPSRSTAACGCSRSIGFAERRGSAEIARGLFEDLTPPPPAPASRRPARDEAPAARPSGSGARSTGCRERRVRLGLQIACAAAIACDRPLHAVRQPRPE